MLYEIGATLKKYRNAAGMSVKEISDFLTQKGFKASESTIYSWENDNSQPTPGALLAMCKAYKIENVLQAFGFNGCNQEGNLCLDLHEMEHIKKYRKLDEYGKDLVTTVLDKEHTRCTSGTEAETAVNIEPVKTITLKYANNKASAGEGFVDLGDMDTEIDVEYNELTHKADFCVTVTGRSMEPKFKDGDVLLVRQQPAVEENEIGIFIVDDKGYVKINGEKELISLNKKYPNIPKTESTLCFGKVVGVLKKEWIK